MKFPESIKLVTNTLWQIKNQEDFVWVIEDLMTPGEITEMADRILIIKMLKEGKWQREIASKLWVSITTVSRGSRVLQYDRKAIHKYI
jgi:TrpR-related protein YerC/YecD